jgi:hypothetical protein
MVVCALELGDEQVPGQGKTVTQKRKGTDKAKRSRDSKTRQSNKQ